MTIPISSTYPISFDTNQNLYEVHDALRVRLVEDYNPGDTSITVLGDATTMNSFSSTGIITLTDQCNEPEYRAISFYYGSKTLTTFDQLELLPGFTDVVKPKNLTDVTQNVMSIHHNSLKNALISIEQFAGKINDTPSYKGTMDQRINYLRNLALSPKAWFSVDKTIGLAPLTVEFTDQSFRLGDDGSSHTLSRIWNFGDNSPSIISLITTDETTEVPSNITNSLINDTDGGTIKKTYTKPGLYTVSLTVSNDFGSDVVTFQNLINARFPAPDFALINFAQYQGQILTPGIPNDGNLYTTPPKIRAGINSIIEVYIENGINNTTGKTYGGEIVDETNTPIDPITNYTWSFSDDLTHNNSSIAKAVFSVGGFYDLNLRVDTKYGAYRITNYHNSFDIVEQINLWLWSYQGILKNYFCDGGYYWSQNVVSSEFGLISETFKTQGSPLTINVQDQFLTGQNNECQQKREFHRNNGFSQVTTTPSGSTNGSGLLYWSSGRGSSDSISNEKILISSYNGFHDTYTTTTEITRPWNWVGMNSSSKLYFILGGVNSTLPNTSPTNQHKDELNLTDLSTTGSGELANSNYKNGANELTSNEVTYDPLTGLSNQGNMSVYRSTWHNDAGYFLRNQGAGDPQSPAITFFRIKSFYKTSGNISEPFIDIRKLPDMIGSARLEGQLTSLSQGVYFFSNSGALNVYSPTSSVWATSGVAANSASFRLLQDTSILGFDDATQTLLVASDGNQVAYLSFDYSPNTFIKFNESNTTFSAVSSRPSGAQWQMCIF